MDKRALSAVPRPVLTDKNKEALLLVPHMRYLATADRQEVNGTDTLIINFFRADGKELRPEFRTFCQPDDYITQDLTTEKTKWKTGAVNYLTGYLYWYRENGNIAISSVEERKTILEFLYEFKEKHNVPDSIIHSGSLVDNEVENRIDEYQNTIKEWKLRAGHRKEKAEIDLQMEKFGGLPADYDRFVKDMVFSDDNYIFYSRARSRAFCTRCGHEFEIRKDGMYHKEIAIWNDTDRIGHNKTVRCPYCSRFMICKSEGMGRQNLSAVRWSVLVQKYGEEVLVRYFCHTKDFRKDFRNPKIENAERFRTIHTADRVSDFEWGRFKSTQDMRWCIFKERNYGYGMPPETAVPRSAVLYNDNLLEDVAGTCMKYSAVDIYLEYAAQNSRSLNKPWCIDWYFNSYREKPYLEQLLKAGFYRLAQSVLEDHGGTGFVNGKTILKTLGVDKPQFNMLRSLGNPSLRDLKILQYAGRIRQEEFDILRYTHDDGYDRIYEKYLDMRQYTTVYKVNKYIRKQGIKHAMDYFDYIGWMEEMKYDMRNEFNLYPKDFKKAHDDRAEEYVRFQDKKAREDIRRFNRLLKKLRREVSDTEPMRLKAEGLFIRMPEKLDELKSEGESLHHCVGTYRDRVARGETMIFFIRREKEPDKPYYTLEWKGRVVQCRGYKNCGMTPEVKAFVGMFQEMMMQYEDTARRHGKAGKGRRCIL